MELVYQVLMQDTVKGFFNIDKNGNYFFSVVGIYTNTKTFNKVYQLENS